MNNTLLQQSLTESLVSSFCSPLAPSMPQSVSKQARDNNTAWTGMFFSFESHNNRCTVRRNYGSFVNLQQCKSNLSKSICGLFFVSFKLNLCNCLLRSWIYTCIDTKHCTIPQIVSVFWLWLILDVHKHNSKRAACKGSLGCMFSNKHACCPRPVDRILFLPRPNKLIVPVIVRFGF